MSELPLDLVLSNLIPRVLDGETVIRTGLEDEYLDVCSTWRQRISMANGLAFHIGPLLATGEHHQLSDMAPYIKSRAVSHVHIDILSMLAAERFPFYALTSLHMKGNEKDGMDMAIRQRLI